MIFNTSQSINYFATVFAQITLKLYSNQFWAQVFPKHFYRAVLTLWY